MPDEKEFPTGLYVSRPRATAPDFVKGRIAIKRADFLAWLREKDTEEWVRLDIKEGFKEDEEGNKKWYAQVDSWKPQPRKEAVREEADDGLPF